MGLLGLALSVWVPLVVLTWLFEVAWGIKQEVERQGEAEVLGNRGWFRHGQ